jgi:hypothetical protein
MPVGLEWVPRDRAARSGYSRIPRTHVRRRTRRGAVAAALRTPREGSERRRARGSRPNGSSPRTVMGALLGFHVGIWGYATSYTAHAYVAHATVVQQVQKNNDLCGCMGVQVSPMTAAFAESHILTPVLHQRSGGNRVRSLCATGAHIPLMAGSSAVGDSSPIRGSRTLARRHACSRANRKPDQVFVNQDATLGMRASTQPGLVRNGAPGRWAHFARVSSKRLCCKSPCTTAPMSRLPAVALNALALSTATTRIPGPSHTPKRPAIQARDLPHSVEE